MMWRRRLTSTFSYHGFETKAKVTGLDISEKEKAWSIMHPSPPMVEAPPNQPESMYVLFKLKPIGKNNDANGNEERILTIRRDDIAELGLVVGDIVKLKISIIGHYK